MNWQAAHADLGPVLDPAGNRWEIEINGVVAVLLVRAGAFKWVTRREIAAWSERPVVNLSAPDVPLGYEGLRNAGGGRWVRA